MGPKARPLQQEWVLNIKRQCDEQRSAFFFKQWGGWGVNGKKRAKKQNGRLLQGRTWDAVPEAMTNAKIQRLTRQIPDTTDSPISRNRKDSHVDLHDLVPCWLTHEWRSA